MNTQHPNYEITGDAEAMISRRTTTHPFVFDFHEGEFGHSVVIGPTGKGMSFFSADQIADQNQGNDMLTSIRKTATHPSR